MYLGVSCNVLLLFNWMYVVLSSGTTLHLKELFMGRCWSYQTKKKMNIVKCDQLWDAFREGFAYKDPCDVTARNYTKFFELLKVDSDPPLNNAMFYSGASKLVDAFAYVDETYLTLEETLTGFILNNMKWCGSKTHRDGMNLTSCPEWGTECDIVSKAWQISSRKFAQRAVGTATTLLNASRVGGRAYHTTGYFRLYEMPVLQVKHLVVYVAHNIGGYPPYKPSEVCGSGSLLELERDAAAKNITMECIDQPKLVLRIYCLKHPSSEECITKTNTNISTKPGLLWKTVSIILIVTTVIIIVLLALYYGHKYYKHKYDMYLRRISYSSKKSVITNTEEVACNNNEQEHV